MTTGPKCPNCGKPADGIFFTEMAGRPRRTDAFCKTCWVWWTPKTSELPPDPDNPPPPARVKKSPRHTP